MSLLRLLSLGEVLPDLRHDPVDSFPHLFHMFDYRAVRRRLLFPRFSRHIQQPPGLASEQELERGEACRSLRYLPYPEQYIWQHEVPVSLVFGYHSSQHLFEGLVEPFN